MYKFQSNSPEKITVKQAEELIRPIAHQLPLLSPINRAVTLSVFYDASKVIYYKQKELRKKQLKHKEIAQCLELTYFHHLRDKEIIIVGSLAENFGEPFVEDKALDYYEKKVEEVVLDKYGTPITIDDLGISFLYEHHQKGGNYLEYRGKRLPWIKHTLKTSGEIYYGIDEGYEQFYYVSHYVIPLQHATEQPHSYFVVIVRKRKNKTFGFLTAFPLQTYNRFLSKISKWRPVFSTKQ